MVAIHHGGEFTFKAARDRAEQRPVPPRSVHHARSMGCGKFMEALDGEHAGALGGEVTRTSERAAAPFTGLSSGALVYHLYLHRLTSL